ncbi:MAG: hypothetical protein ABUT39_08340 [Acidobacteriota bacterium]
MRVEHILHILEILSLQPAEYFQLAYPRRNTPPSDSAARLRAVLEGLGPLPDDRLQFTPMTPEEVEAIVSGVMRKMLAELNEQKK